MSRVAKKNAKPRVKAQPSQVLEGLPEEDPMAADLATAPPQSSDELKPPTRPTETDEGEAAGSIDAKAGGKTVNISQLQAMSMAEVNHMAKEIGIENFGTMRKHEVIFQILRKNAERSGILFAEGV